MNDEDLREVGEEFRRTGFTGGLNWYRAIRKTSELMAAWRGCPIRQPSLFIAGDRDDVLKFPGMKARIDSLSKVLPGLRGVHILPGAGHWIQRERTHQGNALLVEFVKGL
jgi:pimeloyl-ACP methyl ester carboxylesterase